MDRVSPSRWRDAWGVSRRWILGRELLYAVAVTAVDFVIYVGPEHHKVSSAPLQYLWTFLAAAVILGVGRFVFALVTHPHRVLKQELQDHLSNHPHVAATTPDRPVPDFRPELRAASEMLAQEHGDHGVVDGWINRVFEKLFEWSPAVAIDFRGDQMVPSPESVNERDAWLANPPASARAPISSVFNILNNPALNPPSPPPLEYDPELTRLKTYRDRLLRLVPQ